MLDHKLRNIKDIPFRIIPPELSRNLNPNAISVIAGIIGLASIACILAGQLTLALVCWLTNRVLDGLDGHIARLHHKQSDFGGFIDINIDLLMYAGIIIAFAFTGNPAVLYVSLALILMALFYINIGQLYMTSALLEKQGRARLAKTAINMPRSIIEGFETIVLYTLCFMFPQSIPAIWVVFIILMTGNIIQRFFWAKKHIKKDRDTTHIYPSLRVDR